MGERAKLTGAARYLQFFFNLSLVLVFLYLLVQFILTVQRDVEHRRSYQWSLQRNLWR